MASDFREVSGLRVRHRIFYTILRPLVSLFLKCFYGYRYRVAKDLPEQYIVLSNHATDFDPVFVGVSFKRQMYFVASEHIARWKHFYRLLDYVLAPIMRRKGTVASTTVKEMMRYLKKGANVCLFAEGARTWDGVTAPIHPSTAKMIQHAGVALVTFRIEGGYFFSPLWSVGKPRRGKVQGGVVNVYTKEQLAAMTVEEIHRAIETDLHEDAYARQLTAPTPYRSKRPAERLETLLFTCPHCGMVDTFSSEGDTVQCKACHFSFTVDTFGFLQGAPYRTVKELYDWQSGQVPEHMQNGVAYSSPFATLSVVSNHTEQPLDSGVLTMDGDTLRCGETAFAVGDITDMAMHGRHAIVFSVDKIYYELIPETRSNALKFLLYYKACKAHIPAL